MQAGHAVVWAVVCWDAQGAGEERGMARPFSTEEKAQWAKGVLAAHYPGREYVVVRQLTEKPVDPERMVVFEGWAVEDIGKLELADKYKAWSE
ncbi:hypothetical protein D3C81_2019110 [compost metagenome]